MTLCRSLAATALIALTLAAPQARGQDSPFTQAVAAMADRDWAGAYTLAEPAGSVARDIVTWTRLRADAPPTPAKGTEADPDIPPPEERPAFSDYLAFLAARPDWPGLDRLRARGEEVIPADANPAEVIAYFTDKPPQTGQGVVRLAQALIATGKQDEATAALTEAWLGLGLTDSGQDALMGAFPDILAPLHAARTDAMLWRWRTTDASRMLPLLDSDQKALAEARIALITNAGDQTAKLNAVPDSLKDNPGLAYDRFNRMADGGDYTDAVELLKSRTTTESLGDPFRWGSWRATLARWAMREGRPDEAYALAANHFMTEGDIYADLEWVAGYVALTYLDNPTRAQQHFQRVETAAKGPISLARGAYWTARASEVLGQTEAATAAYTRAAQNQTAFYGLLAAERMGLPLDPALTGQEEFPDWRQAGFLHNDLTQAMLLLMAADDRTSAVLFATKLAQTLDRDGIGQMGAMFAAMDEPFLSVLTGKAATERGIVLPGVAWPIHRLATLDLPVAPELALAIARRESEFNFTVGSPVGALGLMQLMPDTAEEVAVELGLPYLKDRLTSDWEYNATLGSRYLANLEQMFGDTPVMIAAGYNAGPSRPRTWATQRGDPRDGTTDVVDWIEHIPFTETRNYVMRVTESIPIYHARLTGQTGPVNFKAILTGAKPFIRPQARPAN
jgi:soluble lytic murein transglycosylase